jgi:hypothetical protein
MKWLIVNSRFNFIPLFTPEKHSDEIIFFYIFPSILVALQ